MAKRKRINRNGPAAGNGARVEAGRGAGSAAPVGEGARAGASSLQGELEAALKLLTQEEADGIIGSPGEEYGTLVRGMQSLLGMQFAFVKGAGLPQSPAVLRVMAQTLQMALALAHTAYALGVKRGRGEGREEQGGAEVSGG